MCLLANIIDKAEKTLLMILRNNSEETCYAEGLVHIFVLYGDVSRISYVIL